MFDNKISVIIPLYNTEKYIKRCLDSITEQTYDNLEIIVVNDYSSDKGPDTVLQLAENDSRISMLNHEKNKGLFHARITGVEHATGDYIAFVDSDDYISRDFFRILVQKAEEDSCDIVIGKATHEDEKGYRYIHNMYDSTDFGILKDENILSLFWDQRGYNFIWHTVWNKLYRKELWDKALPILKKQDKHLIMAEDFVFSSIIINFAQKLSSVEYGCYYYFQHSGASTSLNGNVTKFVKNITDLSVAFDFVEQCINSDIYRLDVKEKFKTWKRLYKFLWYRNVKNSDLTEKQKSDLINFLDEKMPDVEAENKFPDYFYHVTSPYDNRYNDLANLICSEKTECVSFDIFDTVLIRPFYDPHDLFAMLNKEYSVLAPCDKRDFSKIRDEAEAQARKKLIYCDLPMKEEVTLDDIYEEITNCYGVSKETAEKIKDSELKAEMHFCKKRKSAYNLYRLALHCGKKVFFTTDTYFDRKFIKKLLENNGYAEYENLLISSEENQTKRTGTLFGSLISRAGCSPENILHIGDNWDSDITASENRGIKAFFYAKCVDCIQFNIPSIKATHSCGPYKEPSGSMVNYQKAMGFLGNRTALALAAIKLYDNPFRSYNEWSEANTSPQFFGYYMLGMHLLGFVKWFTERSIEQGYDTLSFISRDGWLPMKAYEILKPYYIGAPGYTYIYTSRKAAVPCAITGKSDLYDLYELINPNKCTPDELAQLLEPVLEDYSPEIYEEHGIKTDSPIENKESFLDFIQLLYNYHFSQEKADRFTAAVKEYFDPMLSGKSAVVDIGYSGRTQEMLTKVMGHTVDAFYVHTHDEACDSRERKYGFKVNRFYEHTPAITGASRELMFSQYTPSCIGYEQDENGDIAPVFDSFEDIYPLKYLVFQSQTNALQMIDDFCSLFGEYMDIMTMRNTEVSYPFEYFLHNLTDADAWMFECVEFEDDMWAGQTIRLQSQWKEDIAYHKIVPYYAVGQKEIVKEIEVVKEIVYMDKPPLSYEELAYELFERSGVKAKGKLRKASFWFGVDRKIFFDKLIKRHKKD